MNETIKGALVSKTMWAASIIGILGVIEQYQGLITLVIGQQKTGVVMMVVAAIMGVLRVITGTSLADKGDISKG